MIVSGGITPNTWQIQNHDHTNPSGRVLRRTITIQINDTPITAPDALRLATAIRLVAKNPA